MAKIEHELRLTIFTRTSTGSELTPMGEMIAERAERVMAAAQTSRETPRWWPAATPAPFGWGWAPY